MRGLLRAAAIGFAVITATGAVAEPVSPDLAGARRYVSTMRLTLQNAGIDLTRVKLQPDRLLVDYRVLGEGPRSEYALAAVLALTQPIIDYDAIDPEIIRVRSMSGGRKLLVLSVRPDEMENIVASTVGASDREEINTLRAATLAALNDGTDE